MPTMASLGEAYPMFAGSAQQPSPCVASGPVSAVCPMPLTRIARGLRNDAAAMTLRPRAAAARGCRQMRAHKLRSVGAPTHVMIFCGDIAQTMGAAMPGQTSSWPRCVHSTEQRTGSSCSTHYRVAAQSPNTVHATRGDTSALWVAPTRWLLRSVTGTSSSQVGCGCALSSATRTTIPRHSTCRSLRPTAPKGSAALNFSTP